MHQRAFAMFSDISCLSSLFAGFHQSGATELQPLVASMSLGHAGKFGRLWNGGLSQGQSNIDWYPVDSNGILSDDREDSSVECDCVMFLCLGGMILVTLLRLDLAIEAERLPQVAVILADVMMLVVFSLTHRPCLPLFTLVQSFKMFRLVQWVSTWAQVKVLWCLAATREGASVLDLRLHV